MLTPSMRNWFGRSSRSTVAMLLEPAMPVPADPVPEAATTLDRAKAGTALWTPIRLAVTDALWGNGYQIPGGEVELLRLAKPLGLSAAASLMLLGAGSGGAACSLVTGLGVWVNGFEADPELLRAGTDRLLRSNMGKRARLDSWDPAEPSFPRHRFHHALALEPLQGQRPETVLTAISTGLKSGGQLMMTELVADVPLTTADGLVAQWAKLERRDPKTLPTEIAITRVMGRQGYDVRIVEDLSQRYMHQGIMGWRRLVRAMQDEKPTPDHARAVVAEAEFWLIRLRLMKEGRLRVVRWHGIGGGM